MPALLSGTHLAGLIFFLNPDLPFSQPTLVRAALYYSVLFMPLSIGSHFAVARWSGVTVARLLPWSLTLVAVAGALGDGVHASLYAFLLPEAINTQLIKAGLWLLLSAVLIFYTALLHSLHHRRYGLRSRLLITFAVVGSVYTMLDRRTSYREIPVNPPQIRVHEEAPPPRLVVVTLPTATLDAVLPLARQGKLPFFARMLDRGASARLAVFSPPRSAALWGSWATGKLPFRHGVIGDRLWESPVLGFDGALSILPIAPAFARWGLAGGGARPSTRHDRRSLTIWEILSGAHRDVEILGFATWLGGARPAAEPAPSEAVSSVTVRELVSLARDDLAAAFARDRARNTDARRMLTGSHPPAATLVELSGLEQAARASYGGFASVTFEGRRSTAASGAARAYEAYLAGLDAELALLWEEMVPPRLLAVTSPYGISAPRPLLRPLLTSELELRGTLSANSDGLLLLLGDGIRAGVQADEGRVVDVVPTLLYAVGLPLARDFDGRLLSELFDPAVLQQRALSFVASYEGLSR